MLQRKVEKRSWELLYADDLLLTAEPEDNDVEMLNYAGVEWRGDTENQCK